MNNLIEYRGSNYPIRNILYKEVGSPDEPKQTMVATEELSQILYHDQRCKVAEIKILAQIIDSKILFFLHTVDQEVITDHSLLVQLHDKNPSFVFIIPAEIV